MKFHSFWPNREQTLLLHAVLDPDIDARGHVSLWLDTVDFDRLDAGSQRLLPMLSRRLRHLGIDHPLRARIDGLYRRSFYFDRRLRAQLRIARTALDAIGVRHIVLKGAALGAEVYALGALRPADDLDILIRDHDFDRVRSQLSKLGWVSRGIRPGFFGQAETFDSAMGTLDVHRSPFHEVAAPDAIAPLWQDSRTIAIDGLPAAVLSCHDQVLHTLAHGLRVNTVPPIRWVADAVHCLVAYRDTIDWDRFVERAIRLRYALVAVRGLDYLQREFGVQVPERTMALLRQASGDRQGRLEYAFVRKRYTPLGIWVLSGRGGGGAIDRLRRIARQYARNWGSRSVAGFVARAAVRTLLGRETAVRIWGGG